MAEVVLFHHALGQTDGLFDFATQIEAAGHTVHTPDLFEGRRFTSIPEGVDFADGIGFGALIERGVAAVSALPDGLVYAGFSLGVLPAQKLAQTRPGARGALLFYSCVPYTEFSPTWPDTVPVQIHGMDADPYFVGEGDVEAARDLVATAADAELFMYPGEEHLFAESDLPGYDPEAAGLLRARVLSFLERV